MNPGTIVLMVALGVIALVGLFAAAHAVDIGMSVFGSIMAAFGVLMIFFFLKRYFDEEEARQG